MHFIGFWNVTDQDREQCPPQDIATNSAQTGVPVWGREEPGSSANSSAVVHGAGEQHGPADSAQCGSSMMAQRGCGMHSRGPALGTAVQFPPLGCCSLAPVQGHVCSSPRDSRRVTAPAREQSLVEVKSSLSWEWADADLYREDCLPPFPNWSVSMQMSTPNPHSLIGTNNIFLIGQNGAILICWWRCNGG